MKVHEPSVSVCIPTYNRSSMLKEAIESVLSQTFSDFELLVSDNASTDETEGIVRSFDDTRIHYVKNPKNLGHRTNYGRCLRLARGTYMTMLSDDDLMLPENLAVKVDVLLRNPQVGFVHSKYHVIDAEGQIVRPNTNWGHGVDRMYDALEHGQDVLKAMLLSFNFVNTPTVMFRRACYERVGGYTNQLAHAYDWEFLMRIALYYDVAFVAQPLIKWRFHQGSQTSRHLISTDMVTHNTLSWKELLLAKRLILKEHFYELHSPHDLKTHVWREMSSKTVEIAESMLADGRPKSDVRAFLMEMCHALPEILLDQSVWKVCFKTTLGPRTISVLKRIVPL